MFFNTSFQPKPTIQSHTWERKIRNVSAKSVNMQNSKRRRHEVSDAEIIS